MSEWKLVPCEPTLEMCKAAAELTFSIAPSPRKIYITMLAAAPAAPQSADQPRNVLLDKSLRQYAHDCRIAACGAWSDVRDKNGDINEAKCELARAKEERLRAAIDELADLSAPAAPQSAEPVCPECKGTRLRDSGGVHPWGEPILIPCGCAEPQPSPDKDEIMRLAERAIESASMEELVERRAALDAAVERVCRENETLRNVLDRVRIRQEGEESALERAERERDANEQRALRAEHSVTVCKATIDALALKIDSTEREAAELRTLLNDWLTSFADCIEGGEADELVKHTRAAMKEGK